MLLCTLTLSATSNVVEGNDDSALKSSTLGRLVLEGYSDRIDGADDPKRKAFFQFSKGVALANGPMMEAYEKMKGASKADIQTRFADAYDIFYDADHGIITNTKEAGWELGVGAGGIVDMGVTKFSEVKQAPEVGYKKAIKVSKILPGHTYCVRTSSGKHYGKFHILSQDKDAGTIEITWAFQSDGSRSF